METDSHRLESVIGSLVHVRLVHSIGSGKPDGMVWVGDNTRFGKVKSKGKGRSKSPERLLRKMCLARDDQFWRGTFL